MSSKPEAGQPGTDDKHARIQEQQRQEAGLNDDGAGPKEVFAHPDAKGSGKQQIGEGSYEATRDYQENIKNYLDKADVQADAKAAKPDSPQQERELQQAEGEGLSHSKSPGK
ncbi:MAG: hypothetical protein LH479_08875 [Polaromonas sp.]|nr:hypothetical protein [Polaromonas sp.]